MKKLVFAGLILTLGVVNSTLAQTYRTVSYPTTYTTAIGLRVGGTTGLTIKHFYRPSVALEGIIGGFPNGFSVTGLVEKHVTAFNEPGLSWYYGGGGHIAAYNAGDPHYNRFGRDLNYTYTNDVGFGVDGIVGLEWQLPDNVPIGISFDLKPFIEVTTGGDVGLALDPSLGIKFLFR